MKNMTQVQRILFTNMTLLSMAGIWLTGFGNVHWFVYIVPAALIFAAITGYCAGMDIIKTTLKTFNMDSNDTQRI